MTALELLTSLAMEANMPFARPDLSKAALEEIGILRSGTTIVFY